MITQETISFMTNLRRDLHKHAESGWREFRTTSLITEELERLGFQVKLGTEVINPGSAMGRPSQAELERQIDRAISQGANPEIIARMGGYTGCCGIWDTGRPGPVIALRFDIDSNDVVESTKESHRPNREGFASINHGMMHACGHDGHISMGLGLARTLAAMPEKLCGKIKLLFQPAEEGLRGGKPMADSGIVDDVDFLLSGHLGMGVPLGTIFASTAGFLSSTKLDVTFTGVSAHAGAAPNEGKNALLAAAAATLLMNAIPPHKDGPTRLNVGVLNAGVGRNVVPPNAYMQLETRGGSFQLNEYVYEHVEQILTHIGPMYGVDCKWVKAGSASDCVCDRQLKELIEQCVTEEFPQLTLGEARNIGGSEDCTWLIKAVQEHGGQGNYIMIGTDIAAGHHNELFDINEDALEIGVRVYEAAVLRLLADPDKYR